MKVNSSLVPNESPCATHSHKKLSGSIVNLSKNITWIFAAFLFLLSAEVAVVFISLDESGIISHLKREGDSNVTTSNETELIRTEDDVVIFYNLFTPNEVERQENVLNITKEQIKYRQYSFFPNATLYYISLGKEVTSIENCENCIRLEYVPEGNEIVTLQKLQYFCKNNTNKDVVYIHNKGSFTPTQENDLLRRMLTKSVFSKECLNDRHYKPMTSTMSCKCNVCSARFSPLPHFHAPGNMWVASCSYISKLVPPGEMATYMNNAVNTAPQSVFGNTKRIQSDAHLGKERYSAEHWVHSHPDICPCDVYPGSYTWNYDRMALSDDWVPHLMKAPRFPFMQDYMMDPYLQNLRKSKLGNWFSLRGRLHEWQSLYRTLPANDSWVWKFYEISAF